jgi:hypothetical protein
MRIQLVFPVGIVLGLSLFAVGGEPVASAQMSAPVSAIPLSGGSTQSCGTVTADKTAKVGDGLTEVIGEASRFGKQAGCNAFVVDFTIDHAAANVKEHVSADVQFLGYDAQREHQTGNQQYYAKITKPECTAWQQSITVYKKKSDGTFGEVGGGDLKSTWDAGATGFGGPVCTFAPGAGFRSIGTIAPPAAGAAAETYRVAIYVGGAVAVVAGAMHPAK